MEFNSETMSKVFCNFNDLEKYEIIDGFQFSIQCTEYNNNLLRRGVKKNKHLHSFDDCINLAIWKVVNEFPLVKNLRESYVDSTLLLDRNYHTIDYGIRHKVFFEQFRNINSMEFLKDFPENIKIDYGIPYSNDGEIVLYRNVQGTFTFEVEEPIKNLNSELDEQKFLNYVKWSNKLKMLDYTNNDFVKLTANSIETKHRDEFKQIRPTVIEELKGFLKKFNEHISDKCKIKSKYCNSDAKGIRLIIGDDKVEFFDKDWSLSNATNFHIIDKMRRNIHKPLVRELDKFIPFRFSKEKIDYDVFIMSEILSRYENKIKSYYNKNFYENEYKHSDTLLYKAQLNTYIKLLYEALYDNGKFVDIVNELRVFK